MKPQCNFCNKSTDNLMHVLIITAHILTAKLTLNISGFFAKAQHCEAIK